MVYTGCFTREPPACGTKPVGEALTWATVRLRECRHIRADRIQVKMRMQTGQFLQVLVMRLCLLYLSVLWERILCLTGEHCPSLVSQDRDMQMPPVSNMTWTC